MFSTIRMKPLIKIGYWIIPVAQAHGKFEKNKIAANKIYFSKQ